MTQRQLSQIQLAHSQTIQAIAWIILIIGHSKPTDLSPNARL